ncbi:MAG TPA: hypothetical protein VNS63_17320 [Blastocatellia bacterium]|nr:hypothetical protein [Blastocatellia bacterium]
MAKRKSDPGEIDYFEQQERWHQEERKEKQAKLARVWLHARKPDRDKRPKTVQIQKQTFKVKDDQHGQPLIGLLSGPPSEIEFTIVRIPQIPGPPKGAIRVPNDFPAQVMAKISNRLEHRRLLSRLLVARDLDLKEDRLQRKLQAAHTTYRKLVSLCKKKHKASINQPISKTLSLRLRSVS